MATTTTNLGLIKPAGSDKIRIAQINGNMDILDEKVGAVGNTSLQTQATLTANELAGAESAIAIVASGNTHGAIAAGQYVFVKNHSTLDNGLYTANSAIAANAELSSSNLTAVSAGGLNATNTAIATLNSNTFNKVPISQAFTGNLNNVDLIGFYFGQDTSMQNAPTSIGRYYSVVCFGRYQIASAHSASGTVQTFVRHYINDQWYQWKSVEYTGGWLSSGTNINDVLIPGSYGISSDNSYTGLPTGATSGILEVVAPDSNYSIWVMQRLINGTNIYVRWRTGNNGTTFGSWYKYTGTTV